jgi:hypothetical protein
MTNHGMTEEDTRDRERWRRKTTVDKPVDVDDDDDDILQEYIFLMF